ncbi:prefoldin subunit [Persephonella sp.]|jgi:chaperonin cofactor prefoldin
MKNTESAKQQIEKTLKLLEQMPENRRYFYNTGVLMIEITKEEAIKMLKKELEGLRGNT